MQGTQQRVLVVSTHLTRNPEDPSMDALRAKQIGQVSSGTRLTHSVGP